MRHNPRHGFDEEMRRLGWVEGRNLAVELVAANPDVIVAAGIADALPVHAQTRTLPIDLRPPTRSSSDAMGAVVPASWVTISTTSKLSN